MAGAVCANQEILKFNGIAASTQSQTCKPGAKVRLDGPSEEAFRQSRLDMQQLSDVVKTYLWLDCKNIESIEFEGFVRGDAEPIYHARARQSDDWFLEEVRPDELEVEEPQQPEPPREPEPAPPEPSVAQQASPPPSPATPSAPPPQPAPAHTPSRDFESLEALEAAARNSAAAQLELAKGLLDLEGRIETIDFPDDPTRGIEMLEKLAADGNADAMQLLAEAYSSNPQSPLNMSLLGSLSGKDFVSEAMDHANAAALLTLNAASGGSERAVAALDAAGDGGSHHAYYALGMMYMLDREQENMPYGQSFLEQELEIDGDTSGPGNVDVGMQFLKLAAESGNPDAQELLGDLEVEFEISEPAQGSSPTLPTLAMSDDEEQSQGTGSSSSSAFGQSQSSSEDEQGGQSSQAAQGQATAAAPSVAPAFGEGSAASLASAEAMIDAGALFDILDTRTTSQAAASGPSSASSSSSASGTVASTGQGRAASGSAGATAASTMAGGQPATSTLGGGGRIENIYAPPGGIEDAKMNSPMAEPEIVD